MHVSHESIPSPESSQASGSQVSPLAHSDFFSGKIMDTSLHTHNIESNNSVYNSELTDVQSDISNSDTLTHQVHDHEQPSLCMEKLDHVNGTFDQSPTTILDIGSITKSKNGNLPAITLLHLTVERLHQDQYLDPALRPIRHYLLTDYQIQKD